MKIADLEKGIASLEYKLIDRQLWYCRVVDCIYCKHPTIQREIKLEGSEDALECLNCGKIWHKDQTIVEYK